MLYTRRRGTAVTLLLTAHPLRAVAMAAALAVAAALAGRSGNEVALVGLTVLTGQAVLGWFNDVLDRGRDHDLGRPRKPIAQGWIDPGTVAFAASCGVLLVVPLAVSNGTVAGAAYLGSLACGALSDLFWRRTWLSWLPWAVGFGLLPAFLSYGGWGGGVHGGPPTVAMVVLAALLGVGLHFAASLNDLVEDNQAGLRHLPLRIALRIGAVPLLWLTTVYIALVLAGMVVAVMMVGLVQG